MLVTASTTEVGDLTDATEAVEIYSEHLPELEDGRLHGWTLLAQGTFRAALLHERSHTVYKIPLELGEQGDANIGEEQYWAMMRRHAQWRDFVPDHTLHHVVIGPFGGISAMAMPFLPEVANMPAVPVELVQAAEHVGCYDANRRNVRYRDGRWLLIDAGGAEHWDDPTVFGPSTGDGCYVCNPYHEAGTARTMSGTARLLPPPAPAASPFRCITCSAELPGAFSPCSQPACLAEEIRREAAWKRYDDA